MVVLFGFLSSLLPLIYNTLIIRDFDVFIFCHSHRHYRYIFRFHWGRWQIIWSNISAALSHGRMPGHDARTLPRMPMISAGYSFPRKRAILEDQRLPTPLASISFISCQAISNTLILFWEIAAFARAGLMPTTLWRIPRSLPSRHFNILFSALHFLMGLGFRANTTSFDGWCSQLLII